MYCISSLLIYQLLLPVAVTGVLPVTISLLVHWFLSDHRSEALQAGMACSPLGWMTTWEQQSKVELDFTGCFLNSSFFECLYRTWNQCTDVKLKKLDVTQNELPVDTSNLQQMTDKLILDSD